MTWNDFVHSFLSLRQLQRGSAVYLLNPTSARLSASPTPRFSQRRRVLSPAGCPPCSPVRLELRSQRNRRSPGTARTCKDKTRPVCCQTKLHFPFASRGPVGEGKARLFFCNGDQQRPPLVASDWLESREKDESLLNSVVENLQRKGLKCDGKGAFKLFSESGKSDGFSTENQLSAGRKKTFSLLNCVFCIR